MMHQIFEKALLVVAFAMLIFPANEAAAWDNGGISNVTVRKVVVLQDGSFYIRTDTDLCDAESNTVGYVYRNTRLNENRLVWNQAGADMMLSTSIAAKLSGSKVTVYADDSGTSYGCMMGAISLD